MSDVMPLASILWGIVGSLIAWFLLRLWDVTGRFDPVTSALEVERLIHLSQGAPLLFPDSTPEEITAYLERLNAHYAYTKSARVPSSGSPP